MPTTRRRIKRQRRVEIELDEHTTYVFETGHDHFGDCGLGYGLAYSDAGTNEDIAAKREATRELWHRVESSFIAAWIAHSPCSRPWAWWAWSDKPEARRRHIGGAAPQWERLEQLYPGRLSWFGVCPISTAYPSAEYESQGDYLNRHNLLTAAERAVYESGDIPEPKEPRLKVAR